MTASQKIRFIFKVLFYLPGTLMHEMAHLLGFKMMGFRDLHFSIIPKNIFSSYEITMGTATAVLPSNYSRVRLIIPSILPKMFLIALYFFLQHYELIEIIVYSNALSISIYFDSLSLSDYKTYFVLYVSAQLLWASFLSFQDWKMFFSGLFSLGGLLLLLFIFVFTWIFQYMQF